MHFQQDQSKSQWRALIQKASDINVELGIALGRAYPLELDDNGTLTVEFEPGADRAYTILQSSANLTSFEAFLQKKTDNILKVQVRKAETKNPAMEATLQKPETSPEIYSDLLQEDGIAVVVDEFKGAIVALQGAQKDQQKK